MRAVVVDDQMQVQIVGRLLVDTLEKAYEFLMSVARHAVAGHLAVENAQSEGSTIAGATLMEENHTTDRWLMDEQVLPDDFNA